MSKPSARLPPASRCTPAQVNLWKKQALQHLMDAFSTRRGKAKQQEEVLKDELYGQIGRLKVELDWLKKNFGSLS